MEVKENQILGILCLKSRPVRFPKCGGCERENKDDFLEELSFHKQDRKALVGIGLSGKMKFRSVRLGLFFRQVECQAGRGWSQGLRARCCLKP